jgi:hypothetical protein
MFYPSITAIPAETQNHRIAEKKAQKNIEACRFGLIGRSVVKKG